MWPSSGILPARSETGFVDVLRRVAKRYDLMPSHPAVVQLLQLTPATLLANGVRSSDSTVSALSQDAVSEWFSPMLRAMVYQAGMRGDDLEEAVQRLLVGLPVALASLPEGEPRQANGYLATRVRFVCRDLERWRDGTCRVSVDGIARSTRGSVESLEVVDELIGIDPEYIERLITQERLAAVRTLLGTLTATDRRILFEVVIGGRTHDEVARDSGLSTAACKMRLSRLRKLLRERWREESS